ncbi:integral membrane sensor hybrid histidine kinase [Canicola haemoglobinophilus]|uniref:histidine kinase n=1 Tax=Canicola haemoglobinophilus TaxID=733 RepID=A0AB38HAP7_9PAST|nr:ATP-binding protein [Canicola haemoglobinophilus]STO55009.1 integral membrane sensor hybrid histidine kinase [Canicola haemoglobinophilus]STO69420.1 integral membrane sensor hybrid histidine kinase [Canicola haemoglobinophilus]
MRFFNNTLFSKPYSVRFRLIFFLIIAIFLIIFISSTAILGQNNTYRSLTNLRDRSINQMFSSMTLGVKTAQISTYATRLNQSINALEYQAESEQLAKHAEQLQNLLEQLKQTTDNDNQQVTDIVNHIDLLEKSVQDLLLQGHKRHILRTNILSHLHQSLLYIQHIKRLQKRTALDFTTQEYLSGLLQIEKLIEDATQSNFSSSVFLSIQSSFNFLPSLSGFPSLQAEHQKLLKQFPILIEQGNQLTQINLRIQFLTFQIEALVKNIVQQYTQLAQEKVETVSHASDQIQHKLSQQTNLIIIFALCTIILIIILGHYIYSLLGKRLYSITNALKRLSQGDKNVTVPQQQTQDEIGDLARTFDIFHQNVLQLERTDALLKEKSELLEQTFLAMRDGLAIFDQDFNLASYNAEFKHLLQDYFLQYQQHDLPSLIKFFHQQQAKIVATEQALDLNLLTQIRQETDFLEISYQQQILEWRVSGLNDGLVVFLIDRTQRKKLEADVADNQKMRAIGHLTGGIAHDFNNFLAVIIGNLDLIDPNSLDERQAKRLHRAMKAAENSATLTQRLLAYARKQPLHPTSLDLNQLILDFEDLIKHTIPAGIKVRLDLAENLSAVYIDKNQLETALVNLIINAKDALENEGEIIIRTEELMVQRTHSQQKMVQLSIIDNGCGMDENTKKRVFEPFFTTKQNGRGSGLGLSMVYGFIRQSKGRVIIETKLGQGTNIQLQLPLTAVIEHPQDKTISANVSPIMKGNLLLIEDKTELCDTLNEQLSQLGYQVNICKSGEQAMEYLQQNCKLDYVLSDIMLSGKLTGVEVAKWLNQNRPDVKVLLMTGHTEQIEKTEKFPLLVKPFKLIELQRKLAKM